MKETILKFTRGPYPKNILHTFEIKRHVKFVKYILEMHDIRNIKIAHHWVFTHIRITGHEKECKIITLVIQELEIAIKLLNMKYEKVKENITQEFLVINIFGSLNSFN